MPPTNYNTFRVRGIPAGTTREGLQALVAQAVSCQGAYGVRVRSLAVDASRPREMVATVTFANIPEELSDKCGDWAIEVPHDITLAIDTHFHGCTTLYCPPANEWKSDLLAISGLNGHAFGSFKKKNSSYMWLRDSLPQDFPGCRIIIYGYDTRLQDSRSFQSLLDIGKKFQTAIRQVRQDARKTLILLGHSLGGIVVKEAISLMRGSSIDGDKMTFAAIRSVIFFGVPNQGMDIRSLIPMVGDQANRGFLHTLDHNSPVLRIQAKEFSAAIRDLRCEILNFYETQESPTAHQNVSARLAIITCPQNDNIKKEDGTWSMSGSPAVLVDTHSATHGRPNDSQGHRVSPIDCDHSNLIKFGSAYDEPYVTVTAFLHEIDSHRASQKIPMTKTEEACYQSLGFREQYHRMDSLEPSPGTCDWLIAHGLFIEWLQSSKGFLWIRGKPGSGKSMVMKHALNHIKDSTSGIVASFFIHGQGTELQKTILGIYRSLLHQIYPYSPESFAGLTTRFEEYISQAGKSTQDVKWSWMKSEIRQNFFKGLQKLCRKSRVVVMVDALDEAGEEQAREIFKDLQSLISSLEDSAICRLSLCVACRHYPDVNFNSDKTIVMENFNSLDIKHVVDSRLDSEDIFDDSEKHQLKRKILAKSEGIFQWTSLVTEAVIQTRQNGDPFLATMSNVDRIPRGLDLLYKALLEPNDEQERELKQRKKLFQWVALATEPLVPRVLQHVLALHSKMTYRFVSEYEKSEDFISENDFETKIKSLSKGLIQINGSFQSGRTEFIHQSIPDFLLQHGGLGILSGLPGSDSIRVGHFELSITCLKYLFMEEIRHFRPRPKDPLRLPRFDLLEIWISRFPVVSYAWNNWIYHAASGKEQRKDEDEELCTAVLMDIFCWPGDQVTIAPWIPLVEIFGSQLESWVQHFQPSMSIDWTVTAEFFLIWRAYTEQPYIQIPVWPCGSARLIHFFALTGLLDEITLKIMSSDLEFPVVRSQDCVATPLGYALLGQQKKVVQNMIAAGVQVQHQAGLLGQSPLYLASQWGDPAVVSLLLESGANVDHREKNSWTALHAASHAGQVAAIHILIDAGADVNCQSKCSIFDRWSGLDDGQSPLHVAALNGQTEAARQLIRRGADLNLKSFGRKAPPLFLAISGQMIETTRLLLELGADVHARDSAGNSPIHHIFRGALNLWSVVKWSYNEIPSQRSRDMLELLIQSGCDINAKNELGITPLHLSASSDKSTEFLNLLLSRGSDPNAGAPLGDTPVHRAARSSTKAMEVLLHAGGNVHLETRTAHLWSEGFPIHLAVASTDTTRVQLLIQAGSNVNVVNCEGKTPLGLAMQPRRPLQVRIIQLLIDAGSNVNVACYEGETPLRLALRSQSNRSVQGQVIRLLLAAGVYPNVLCDEIQAADSLPSMAKVLETLIEAGMDPNTRDDEGETPLFWVVRSEMLSKRDKEWDKIGGIQMLLESGADPSITNRIGRSALSYAIRNRDNGVANLLRESGSPEGVWRPYSRISFGRKIVDELTGKLIRFTNRDRS